MVEDNFYDEEYVKECISSDEVKIKKRLIEELFKILQEKSHLIAIKEIEMKCLIEKE